jgi:hypothetical protein
MPTTDAAKIELLKSAYSAFNARDIDSALAVMQPDVEWANGMEGGYVHGHNEVRSYWTRQWSMIDPHVDPLQFQLVGDGRILVDVHAVVRDLSGAIIVDQSVQHLYSFSGDLVQKMEIVPGQRDDG